MSYDLNKGVLVDLRITGETLDVRLHAVLRREPNPPDDRLRTVFDRPHVIEPPERIDLRFAADDTIAKPEVRLRGMSVPVDRALNDVPEWRMCAAAVKCVEIMGEWQMEFRAYVIFNPVPDWKGRTPPVGQMDVIHPVTFSRK